MISLQDKVAYQRGQKRFNGLSRIAVSTVHQQPGLIGAGDELSQPLDQQPATRAAKKKRKLESA